MSQALDLNGKPDKDPHDRVELTIGTRNPDTGMTGFTGQLDDLGVELLGKAIEGLTNTTPGEDGDRQTVVASILLEAYEHEIAICAKAKVTMMK